MKPEDITIKELNNIEKLHKDAQKKMLQPLYDTYKKTSHEGVRQLIKRVCQRLLLLNKQFDVTSWLYLVDVFRNGPIEEKKQAKELFKMKWTGDPCYESTKVLLLADIFDKDEKNPQQAVVLFRELFSKDPCHEEALGGSFFLYHLSHLQPLPVEEIKNRLENVRNDNSFIAKWLRYLIEKQSNPQLPPSRDLLIGVEWAIGYKKILSPSELLQPVNAIEVKWLDDIPEEIKQQALLLGDTENADMDIEKI